MQTNLIIFQIIVLVFSAIIHEYMHGWMADQLGDTTAKDEGRLTLNPLPHIDPFGSVFLPFLLVLSGSPFVFGWAKPVPYNPYNLRDQRYGPAKVALAGPLGNLITAIFFGMLLRFAPLAGNPLLITLLAIIVQINLLLMIFNLLPIPPLDGSKIIAPFLPENIQKFMLNLERYGMILVIVFVMFGFNLIIPLINFLFNLIVGI
ncbi:MAG: Peptidase M50 [Candidatus Falkowbacteria bacterium GW2011_GWD2_38_42]|uniref:Peptidase M50 n=1 Tax=Candidatus Falkowbacteria bacterium GW2011_GWE1_38_31 TaxID=1618638 RepID=A0A0G0MYN8_9BACT|nr:MAG: Peptidase M50 [Candidatus Falkowbacteria bacterium GW2011_GWF2_38_1205]KKQ63294.1 MAG: Peptidase M50 [Candidatus Falkowbacteria bacterium GW2011_GWF1_38_22]KKQ65588.1 MAG: Peptidase M50 [Candidatus Falkowbacteria bacterium GW2011_GWE2_38_254]KKQ70026.1 MAG: Peptidase M50 [Candidatus Falkowbacteria bacterium GW2011_GWE1_38_31]KKQ72733.1 MAG: Peptidase M50 [Candidatus Falkowbacteria bacterium GW2011_GWD2_38_42]HAM88152.1 site-2 protease family protein [Candidatus Falkowbacteria bacterium